jgi:DNA-binding transcriptional LysR family regulator
MDYEQLKVFITVVDEGGFTRAAQALYISHSTTSRSVSALEESLGIRLLERDSRSMKLTAAGERLYREGKNLLEQTEYLERQLKAMAEQPSGSLLVAAANLKNERADELCGGFCTEYPAVIFDLQRFELSKVLSLVRAGSADAGITLSYALPEKMQDFEIRRIETSRFCAVVSENHPLACRKTVKTDELRNYAYVGAGRQTSRFTAAVERPVVADRPPEDIIAAPGLESLFMQVRCLNGVTLAPIPMARQYGEGCVLLELEDADTSFDIVAFWRKDSENPLAELFGRFFAK